MFSIPLGSQCIQLASPRPPRQGRFFEKKNAKRSLKNTDLSMFLHRSLARDSLRGSPGTSNLSPEIRLGHCTGTKPDFHRFLVSFWRSGGRPWGPFWRPWATCGRQMPPREIPQARKSEEKIVSDGLLAKIFKKYASGYDFF